MTTFRLELPETFTGEDGRDFGQWIRRFEIAAEAFPEANNKMHILLPSRLAGSAFTIWDSIPTSEQKDYKLVKEKLSSVFGHTNYLATFKSSITARTRHANEPLEVFAAAITTLVGEAFPDYCETAKEGEKFRRFLSGINKSLQVRVQEMGATTFKEALDIALRVERANAGEQTSQHSTIASTTPSSEVDLLQKLLTRIEVLERKVDDLQCKPHRTCSEHVPSRPDYRQQSNSHQQMSERYRTSSSPPRQSRQVYRHRSPLPRDYYYRHGSPSSQGYNSQQRNQTRSHSPQHSPRRHMSPSPQRNTRYDRERVTTRPYTHPQENHERTRYQNQPPNHQNARNSSYRHVSFQDEMPENFN